MFLFSFQKHEPKTKKWGWPSMHSSACMQLDVCLFVDGYEYIEIVSPSYFCIFISITLY